MATSYAESFNARNLSPQEVAETFVVHERFDELWQNNHVVLLGPRGSGKTTLFKMLTVPALHTWRDQQARTIRERIAFRAVYIPTDVHWQHQLRHSTDRLSESPELVRRLSEAAVTTNVLHSICDTFKDLLRYEIGEELHRESALCSILIREWRLPRTSPLLESVAQALRSRVNDLYLWANRTASTQNISVDVESPEYFYLDYFAATAAACGAFDDIFPEGKRQRWALCFDELELAPPWLQERLFNELRSTNERFLFKLSTSPTPHRGSLTGASERNDFRAIRLWPHVNHDQRAFSERLVRSILQRRGVHSVTPATLFGASPLSSTTEEPEYERRSPSWHAMKQLAQYDVSFREVLVRNGIDPDDPTTSDQAKRDQVLRKAKPLVLFRLAFTKRGVDGAPSARRSRKVPPIYSGRDAIYDVADGNPRWLIGIVDDLLGRVPPSRYEAAQPIAQSVQANVLKAVSEQFGALIQALPEATTHVDGAEVTLYGLLQRIATYFFRALTQRRFTLDPNGSFFVDPDVPEELMPLLRKAVYEGAIMLVDPTENAVGPELLGKRFRLSYRLAPTLRLPLRLYDPIPLSRCFQEDQDEGLDALVRENRAVADPRQHHLDFGWAQ